MQDLVTLVRQFQEQAQTFAQTIGGNAACLEFVLIPPTFEDSASTDAERWSNRHVWNADSAKRKAADMVAAGWVQHWDTNMSVERYICLGFKPNGDKTSMWVGTPGQLRVTIKYTQSVDEKRAELQRQLAELEGNR